MLVIIETPCKAIIISNRKGTKKLNTTIKE